MFERLMAASLGLSSLGVVVLLGQDLLYRSLSNETQLNLALLAILLLGAATMAIGGLLWIIVARNFRFEHSAGRQNMAGCIMHICLFELPPVVVGGYLFVTSLGRIFR